MLFFPVEAARSASSIMPSWYPSELYSSSRPERSPPRRKEDSATSRSPWASASSPSSRHLLSLCSPSARALAWRRSPRDTQRSNRYSGSVAT